MKTKGKHEQVCLTKFQCRRKKINSPIHLSSLIGRWRLKRGYKNQCQMIDLSRIAPQPLPPGTAPPPVPKYHSIATQTYPDSNIPSIRHPFPWGWCAISAHLCVAMGPSTMSTHGRYLMNGESHPPAPRPCVCVCSVVSDSLQPCGILQARMLEWVAISFSRKEILIICLLSASWLPI